MILKVISYSVLYLAINTVATVGVVGMTEHGGDVQVARLSHNVDVLTVEVADLKRQVEVLGHRESSISNDAIQNVTLVDRNAGWSALAKAFTAADMQDIDRVIAERERDAR